MPKLLIPNADELEAEREAERKEALAKWQKEAEAELFAMQRAFDVLHPLDRDSRFRALKWLEARLSNSPYYGEPPF